MIGERIKEIREKLELSINGFSKISKIPASTIRDIESGKVKHPRSDVIEKLMSMGYSAEYLLLDDRKRDPVEEVLKRLPPDKLEIHYLVEKALNGDSSALENLKFLLKGLEAKK